MTLPDAHALAIGISGYRHLPALPVTQDAQDVASVLGDPVIGGYPPDHVRTLLEQQATRAAILGELGELARRTTASSTVFIYFSGHGGHARGAAGETCYLMPCDGDPSDLDGTAISGPELSARLRAIPAARLTIVLDCCRASGVAEPRDARLQPALPAATLSPLAQGRGRAVLAASRSDGFAYVVPGARNGVFTHHLVEGLRGAAHVAGGVIRVCDLFHYVQQRVAGEPDIQRPVFKAELEENYPVALCRKAAEAPLAVPPPPDRADYDVFISYRHADREDRKFVLDVVVPLLRKIGLKVLLEHYDFVPGRARVKEIERAVTTSRYTLAILTPSYLAGAFEDFQTVLAKHHAIETGEPRFIPLLRRPCPLDLSTRMTALLDATDDDEVGRVLERLAVTLRQPPAPRLDP